MRYINLKFNSQDNFYCFRIIKSFYHWVKREQKEILKIGCIAIGFAWWNFRWNALWRSIDFQRKFQIGFYVCFVCENDWCSKIDRSIDREYRVVWVIYFIMYCDAYHCRIMFKPVYDKHQATFCVYVPDSSMFCMQTQTGSYSKTVVECVMCVAIFVAIFLKIHNNAIFIYKTKVLEAKK